MASILARNLFHFSRSSALPRVATSVKHYSKPPPYYDPAEGKDVSRDVSMPDGLGASVGIERWELLEQLKGKEDPFNLGGFALEKPGTKDAPTIVPTSEDFRTIGCVCEPDTVAIRWLKMAVGETKRCQCGHYFKLVPE